MKAIHNDFIVKVSSDLVVLYPKDTEKWKQFTTIEKPTDLSFKLFCIPKILKNESNSQHTPHSQDPSVSCFVSQRYWKMKAIHNDGFDFNINGKVVLYPKDTEKWNLAKGKQGDSA